jgi:hypothetical protein
MVRGGFSNKENVELKRQELAGAITRIVINEALAEAKQRAKARDEVKQPKKIITDPED